MHLVLLDDVHLDDALFVRALGKMTASAGRPLVFVHGDGGLAARALEGQGVFEGDAPPEQAEAARRAATRALNRRLVAALTDGGVAAVGIQGSDRGLLALGPDGTLAARDAEWVRALVARGAVPVVSALARREGGERSVPPAAALAALARAWGPEAVAVALTRSMRSGLGEPPLGALPASGLAAHRVALADPEGAGALARAGVPLVVTSPAACFAPGGLLGTRITAD